MAHAVTHRDPFRLRILSFLAVGVALGALVILPILGLLSISRANSDTAELVDLVSSVNAVTDGQLATASGPITAYAATRDPAQRDRALAEIRASRETLAALEFGGGNAAEEGLSRGLEQHLRSALAFADAGERYLREIEAGSADAGSAYPGAVMNLVLTRGAFTSAVTPVSRQLAERRAGAMDDARNLLIAAALIAVVMFSAFGFIDSRRVRREFHLEAGKTRAAERTAHQRGEMVNFASHELRNPLTVLMMSTELLAQAARDRGDPELEEMASDAHSAALRSQALVEELLDLGRLDADRLTLALSTTAIRPELDAAIEVTATRHGYRPVFIDGGPEISVVADARRLRVILRNVLDNAFKYSPPGSPVRVSIARDDGLVTVEVRDEGEGVPVADRERIFERFERRAETEHIAGVGIGLYLSRELARRMEGDLCVEESDSGTAFRLELPAATSAA